MNENRKERRKEAKWVSPSVGHRWRPRTERRCADDLIRRIQVGNAEEKKILFLKDVNNFFTCWFSFDWSVKTDTEVLSILLFLDWVIEMVCVDMIENSLRNRYTFRHFMHIHEQFKSEVEKWYRGRQKFRFSKYNWSSSAGHACTHAYVRIRASYTTKQTHHQQQPRAR